MHSPSGELNLDALLGQVMTQVCIGSSSITVHFYKEVPHPAAGQWGQGSSISISSGFELHNSSIQGGAVKSNCFKSHGAQLCRFIGESIVAVKILPLNNLLLEFSNKEELIVLTDESGFESYQLSGSDGYLSSLMRMYLFSEED